MGDVVWLEQAFKKAGIPIDVYPGAYDRGHGDLIGDKPFMHHTGSFGATPGSIANHPELGLCSQLYLATNGRFTLCGVGVAYHAGIGSGYGLPTNNGNFYSAGIEAAHNGTAAWGAPQYNAYLMGVQTMNKHRKAPWNDVVAHKEYGAIQGKWDPGNLDMKLFRQRLLQDQSKNEPPVVINMIELEAKQNPWVGVRHGKPGAEGETRVGKDGKGRFVAYDNAHIYFHPSTGAFAVPHADPKIPGSGIFEAWSRRNWEGGVLGYPVRDFSPIEAHGIKGAVMAFQGGVLYVANDPKIGDRVVTGIIGQRWARDGYEKGDLGWPTSDEYDNGTGGRRQNFQFGTLEWDPSGAVKEIGDAAFSMNIVDHKGLPVALHGVQLVAA